MFTLTFSKLDKLGDFDEKYGQAYWGEVNEDLKPVKFNSMNQDITQDDTIECEERAEKQSSKGTIYYQLKKVRVISTHPTTPSSSSSTENDVAQTPPTQTDTQFLSKQLDRIEKKLDQLLGVENDEQIMDELPNEWKT